MKQQGEGVVRAILFGIMLLIWGQETKADVIAGWDVSGVELDTGLGIETDQPPYTFSATYDVAPVQAQLTLGSGVSRSTARHQYGFKISEATTHLTEAIQRNHYLAFSMQVAAGYTLTLSSITMNGESTASGCSGVALLSSVEGFEAGKELAFTDAANRDGGFDTDEDGFGNPIYLTDPNYAGLTGTVSFRLYGWGSTSGRGVTRIRDEVGDDLVINGMIVQNIPEPAVLSLLALSGVGAVGIKRWFMK